MNQNTLDIIETVNLLSPVVLLKEVDNIIKNKGEKYFFMPEYYMHKEHKHIFWNIVYYFKMLQLPLFVMTALRNDVYLNPILEELIFIREMSKDKKISSSPLKHYATNEIKHSLNLESLKNYGTNPNNNNNYDTSSKKSYVVVDNASILSTPTRKVNNNKEWENIYNKM